MVEVLDAVLQLHLEVSHLESAVEDGKRGLIRYLESRCQATGRVAV